MTRNTLTFFKHSMALLLTFVASYGFGQDIFGTWKTIDDETDKPKSLVRIYKKDGKAFGEIIRLYRDPDEDPDPVCDKCTDHRKDKRVLGMIIITDLERDGDEWSGGEILDPANGKVYRCKIWRDEDKLKVRGYIAFLFRTQTWLPSS